MTPNEPITFYSKADTQDEYGTLSQTRTKVCDALARVRPLSGSERNRGDQREDFANYRFTIHWRSDLSEAHILVWRGTDYQITFIADNGPRERYMYIDAERGGAM